MTGAVLGVKPLWKNATTLDSHRPEHGETARFGKTRVAGEIKVTVHGRFKVTDMLNIALRLRQECKDNEKKKKSKQI